MIEIALVSDLTLILSNFRAVHILCIWCCNELHRNLQEGMSISLHVGIFLLNFRHLASLVTYAPS